MEDMGNAWKVVVGLILLLPMTAYVVGSLVAAAEEPEQRTPIIVQEHSQAPDDPGQSPTDKPTKPSDDKTDRGDDHGGNSGSGGGDDDPEVITPSPDDLDDDNGVDNSGPGNAEDRGGDDSSGKGSGHG